MIIYFWPRAVLHVDGDAFFASCLQSIDPTLRGKPVVVGRDRGIATAVSPEAKKAGIVRGMPMYQIKKICPECIIANSDYELYEMISHKMFEIIRKYTPLVEPYSIDEAFANITGLRRMHHSSYQDIAKKIKHEIQESLDISVSVGLSINKSLAKLASNHQKPNGLSVFPGKEIHLLLSKTPIEAVWGIGPNTSALLKKYQINTALDFAKKPEKFVVNVLTKPGVEIWQELNGEYVFHLNPQPKNTYKSISKIHTFQPSSNADFIYGQLVNNLEAVCTKARRFKLISKKIYIGLKGQDFKMYGAEIRLPYESNYHTEMLPLVKDSFSSLFKHSKLYRATTVILSDLQNFTQKQYSLFDDHNQSKKIKLLFDSIDSLSDRYGTDTVKTASTLFSYKRGTKKTLPMPTLYLGI